MKKLIGIIVITLLVTSTIAAQKGPNNQKNGNDFTPEQKATLQAKKMTLNLDLNANQQTAVYNLMLQNNTQNKSTKETMQQKKQNGVEISSDEKFEMQKKRLDQQISHKAALKNILTKEQYEQWEKQMAQKNRQGKSKNNNGKNNNKKGMQNGNPQNNTPKYKN